jgi:hypothetical protein
LASGKIGLLQDTKREQKKTDLKKVAKIKKITKKINTQSKQQNVTGHHDKSPYHFHMTKE